MKPARISSNPSGPKWFVQIGKFTIESMPFGTLVGALDMAVRLVDADRSVHIIAPNGIRLSLAATGLLMFGAATEVL